MAASIEQRAKLRDLGCCTVAYGGSYSFEAIRAAARGSLYAVHCASAFMHYDVSDDDLMYKSNHLIAANLIKACRILRIVKLVVQSTEAVLYDGRPLHNVDENYPFPLNPIGSCGRSMQDIENLVLAANGPELRTVIVRPRLLWGRDDEAFLPSLLQNARSGALRLVGGGDYFTSTCHVANACEGIICAISEAKGGEVFFLTDGRPVKFRQFVRALLKASGMRKVDQVTDRAIPFWLARALALICEALGRISGTQPRMTRSGIGLIGQELTFVDERARRELGYRGSVSMACGFDEVEGRRVALRKESRGASS